MTSARVPHVADLPDIRSWLYADAWLRYEPRISKRLPIPILPQTYYREPGLYLPLSCAFSVVASAEGVGTTVAIDSSGAGGGSGLIVYVTAQDNDTQGITDSKGNSPTGLTAREGSGSDTTVRLWYQSDPIVGANHTASAAVAYGYVAMIALSGAASNPFDQENGAIVNPGTSLATGSITPLEDNEIVIAGLALGNNGSGISVNGSFTLAQDTSAVQFTSYGGALAYLIQTSAAAANPSFLWSNASTAAAAIASFKAAGGGGGSSILRQMMQHLN